MQITKADVTQVDLNLRHPVRMAGLPEVGQVSAFFVRIETRDGLTAWGCTVAHPDLTGDNPADVYQACLACADRVPDLHPMNIEFSLDQIASLVSDAPSAYCAFDLAFHDLLGLAAGIPLYRLLGGYRNRIQTSATIPLCGVEESVEIACSRANHGFRMLKIKGGLHPDQDVRRIQAIHRALPEHILRLDADGAYTVQQALDVARVLEGKLQMFEQPTPANDLDSLRQVTDGCSIPVIADQSVTEPVSALHLAAGHFADGLSIKISNCGGFRCARQIDSIARAARLATMVSCLVEPALLIAAGLSFALSSPNVQYGDLDGHIDLENDPTLPGFIMEEGWLVASDVPGLGCTVNL